MRTRLQRSERDFMMRKKPVKANPSVFRNIIVILGKKKYLGISIGATFIFGFAYSLLLGLIKIPVINLSFLRMVPATPRDLIFLPFFAIGSGILAALYVHKASSSSNEDIAGASGILAGLVTANCPACPLIFLSLFGISATMAFIAPYIPLLRLLSLFFMAIAIYLMGKRISSNCDKCI